MFRVPRHLRTDLDEALEGIKSGKRLRVGSFHTKVINLLFADGSVQSIPSKMDIFVWKKLFAGEVKDIASIEYTPPQKPEGPIILLCVSVWLFSVVLLFRCAIKSQRKAVTETES
jgi:prepilin-type processing-associated H-X9-DG protein